jgi:hypothetical protein
LGNFNLGKIINERGRESQRKEKRLLASDYGLLIRRGKNIIDNGPFIDKLPEKTMPEGHHHKEENNADSD